MKKKTELLFESRVAANFMQSAGISRETSNGLLEEMYGSSIDEYGDLYEVEGEEELEAPEEMEAPMGDEEAPMGDEEAPMGDEEAPMGDEEAPEEMEADVEGPMGGDDADKEAKLEQIFKDLADLVGVEVEVEGGGEPPAELEEGGYGMDKKLEEEESLEEMDDAVLEETVRAILAK